MQNARGAALTSDASPPTPVPPAAPQLRGKQQRPMRLRQLLMRHGAMPLLLGTAAAVLVLDQVTKYLAVRQLSDRLPVTVLRIDALPDAVDPLLRLRLVYNPGAAFGLASEVTFLLPLLAVVVCVAILRAARQLRSLAWTVGLALLLGGALGNLIDRVIRDPGWLRGEVIDFLELPKWPVFNVADMAIVAAAVLLALLSITGRQLDGTTVGKPHVAKRRSRGRQSSVPSDDHV